MDTKSTEIDDLVRFFSDLFSLLNTIISFFVGITGIFGGSAKSG